MLAEIQADLQCRKREVLNGDLVSSPGRDASKMFCTLLGLAVVQVVVLDVF